MSYLHVNLSIFEFVDLWCQACGADDSANLDGADNENGQTQNQCRVFDLILQGLITVRNYVFVSNKSDNAYN